MSAVARAGVVAFARDLHRHLELAHSPLEHRVDRGRRRSSKRSPSTCSHALADHLFLLEAGQLEGASPAADHAALAVADEERGVRRRVVVVEQLEEEREAALRAAAFGSRVKPTLRSTLGRAVAAVGADERVGHGPATAYARRAWRWPHCTRDQNSAGPAGVGGSQAQVGERRGGRHPPARRALDQAQLEQIGLVDVLDRVLLLADRDRERREPDRAAAELLADRAQDLAVEAVEAELVDLEQLERRVRRVRRDDARPSRTSAKSRTRLSSRLATRGVPRLRSAIALAPSVVELDLEDPRRAAHDRSPARRAL